MITVKEQVQEMLSNLPNDCTLEDIEYHLYVRHKILNSLEAYNRGEFVSHEVVEEEINEWLKEK